MTDDVKTLFRIMPEHIRRVAKFAVVLGAGLAGLEFVAIVMIYPVFGYLTQSSGTGQQFPLPVIGISIDKSSAQYLAAAALGLMILRSLLTYAYRRWWLSNTARAELDLSDKLLSTYAYAPYAYHLSSNTSDLLSRAMAHVNIVCQSGLVGVVGGCADILLVTGLGAALILVNPAAGIVVSVYLLALAVAFTRMTKRSNKRLAAELEARYSRVYTRVNVLLRGIRELTVFGERERYLKIIYRARAETVDANRRMMLLNDLPRVVLEVTLYTTILVALVALLGMADPDQALPLVALYVVAGLRIMPTVARLLSNLSLGRTGSRMARSLAREIDGIEAVKDVPERLDPIPETNAELRARGVGFIYPGAERAVLTGIDLTIPFGTYCGIVGPSGSGKTTLTSLILGLLEPSEGTLTYGDSQIVPNDPFWFAKVAVLPQDIFLTDESLADNVYAASPPDRDSLTRAVGLAGLHDLIAELPQGVDTLMGENGSRLSQGQRQRVGLARALYKRPEILVLDEPTSALDATTEAHIIQSIEALKGQMTIFAVAHRTQSLSGADVVIRLENGVISAIGSPSKIL